MSLEDFWRNHFEPDVLNTLKPNTQKHYTAMYRKHVQQVLGKFGLNELSRVQVQQLVSLKQQQGYSTQTLAHVRTLLSKIFSVAMSWGWVSENPARGVKLPPMERRRTPKVLTIEEIHKLTEALVEPARTLVQLGLRTGLRIGELIGLRVEDIDLARSLVHVRRSVSRGTETTPKTQASERAIPLAEPTVQLLRDYVSKRRVESVWLFPTSIGTFQNDRTLFLRKVQPVCRKLGIEGFTWHAMRHTFSTYNGNSGVPMPVLQSLLGHTTARTTMVYTHPLESAQREAMDRLTRILFPIVPKSVEDENGRKSLIQ